MRSNKVKNSIIFTALFMALILALTGCRQSPVLEQIIYTNNAKTIDYDHEKLKNDKDGQEDEDLKDENNGDDNKMEDLIQYVFGTEGELPDDGYLPDVQFDPNIDLSGLAEGRTEVIDANSSENSLNEQKKEASEEHKNTGENNEEETVETESGGEESDPFEDIDFEEAEKRTLTDAKGQEQEVPDDVRYFTAVGYAAQMVEMLGGEGWLYASNADFLNNTIVNYACPDVAGGRVKKWWSGDGSRPISDEGVTQLLSLGEGTVCLEISGWSTFSTAQVREMGENGINYYVLPELKSSADLISAARQVAEIMNTETARTKADQYANWVNGVSVALPSMNYYSIYLNSYRNDISYTFTNTSKNYALLPEEAQLAGLTGFGVATAYSYNAGELVSEYMEAAGVINESTAIRSSSISEDEVYITPMFAELNPEFSSGNEKYHNGSGSQSWDYFLTHLSDNNPTDFLGMDQYYQALIVADSGIKSSIRNNWFWKYHPEHYVDGGNLYRAYVNEHEVFWSSIAGEYAIYVNPYGLGDWAEGSVDSPLEAYWIGNVITGMVSSRVLSQEAADFYKNFFSVSLTDEEINEILRVYENADPWE